MEITREQYSRAYEKLMRRAGRVEKQSRTVMNILKLCGILFLAGVAAAFFNAVLGIVIAAVSVIVFVGLFYLEKNFEKKFMLEASHYIPDKSMMKIYSTLSEECFSEKCSSEINEALAAETDIRRRGELRRILANTELLAGDFDGAFRATFKDEELFAMDKFYELVYYELVLRYYVNINSTTGGTEYAEEAYRSFEKLFDECRWAKNDVLALSLAVSSEMYTAYSRQDYERCLEYIDIALVDIGGDKDVLHANNLLNRYKAVDTLLMKADCLYSTGRVSEAEDVCRDALNRADGAPYLRTKAEKLLNDIAENA